MIKLTKGLSYTGAINEIVIWNRELKDGSLERIEGVIVANHKKTTEIRIITKQGNFKFVRVNRGKLEPII